MQLLLAYAFDKEPDRAETAARLHRVAAHYDPLWRVPVRRQGTDADRIGLHLWDAVSSAWRWPSWAEDGELAAATLYLPFGYERVVGDLPPERAPLPLARALADRPAVVLELTAPFVVASLVPGRGQLRLHTDGIGLGRLYQLRFPGGWVWSNRPAAAFRFAGVPAEPDRDGWRAFAATGWFPGERTPFAGAVAVSGGTTIRYDTAGRGFSQSRIDALAIWSADRGGDALAPDRVDEVADALRGVAVSLGRMCPGTVTAGLSGGRDSRLCVAGVLAAGLNISLFTNGAEPGEADVAEELVAALSPEAAGRVRHKVLRPAPGGPPQTSGVALDAPLLRNALAWHRHQEGLRPETYLPSVAPDGLSPATNLNISGVAGEIAHGHFYPSNFAEFAQLPYADRMDALVKALTGRTIRGSGISSDARTTATGHLRRTLEDALRSGLSDARALDYFYAAERLRRWGTTAERIGTVVPLLVPEFVRAAFDLTPQQRRENALHRAVTARLVPEWRDISYYQRPTDLIAPALAPRIGGAVDRDLVAAIVADPSGWAEDGFDPVGVTRSWRLLLAGRGGPSDERLLQRVIWRAVFTDYLDEVNGDQPASRAPLAALPAQRRPRSAERGRRFAARGLRWAARVIER